MARWLDLQLYAARPAGPFHISAFTLLHDSATACYHFLFAGDAFNPFTYK
jgi:hypothetical protein